METTKTNEQERIMARVAIGLLQLVCLAVATVAMVYVMAGDFETPTTALVMLWWVTKLAGLGVAYACCKGYSALKRLEIQYEK